MSAEVLKLICHDLWCRRLHLSRVKRAEWHVLNQLKY